MTEKPLPYGRGQRTGANAYVDQGESFAGRARELALAPRFRAVSVLGNYKARPWDACFADPTSGALTVTLPTAVGRYGDMVIVKNITALATAITIKPERDGETVEDAATLVITGGLRKHQLMSDGANWWAVN